ncbi:hypothetical protein HH682_03160 [Rosenbergiella sp. S61]|uniref:Lipoprotein n=1 Tax=Rosenbergiella gaditana TaxID=2726987 RepID=A0ABS5STT1_9GAMM|nr:hypothetical protein [Rosenbergiella gaditana]MBT0723457.1 hypothetical protein [Rosenbergiella gaditana]
MNKKIISLISMIFTLTACSSYWVSKGTPTIPASEAEDQCYEYAEGKFPVKNEISYSSTKDYSVGPNSCKEKKNTVCVINNTKTESEIIDVNKFSREKEINKCMEKKGWKTRTKILGFSIN